jgi:hypothetical protein
MSIYRIGVLLVSDCEIIDSAHAINVVIEQADQSLLLCVFWMYQPFHVAAHITESSAEFRKSLLYNPFSNTNRYFEGTQHKPSQAFTPKDILRFNA